MENIFKKINSLSEARIVIYIILVSAIIFLVLINSDPVPDIMEARNLVSARECVDDGNCFVTTMNGAPRVRKPPLPTWVTAAAMYITGSTKNIYTARLPNIFLISLASLFVYLTARRWFDKSLALMAALSVVTFLVMQNEARRITWDIFTTTFAFGGVWTLMCAFAPGGAKAKKQEKESTTLPWILASIFFFSLAVLSKGPLPIYSIFVPFIIACVISKERRSFRWWIPITVIIAALILGTSWWAYIYIVHPEIISKLSGEAASWTMKHSNGPLYYLFRAPLLFFPWALALLGSLILPFIKGTDGTPFIRSAKREEIKFFLIWLVFSFVLLSLAPQKKYRYLMGMLMPASFALAFFIGELRERGITGVPSSIRALWTLHTIQTPMTSIALIGVAVYSATKLNTPAWLLVFIIPLALLIYFSIRLRRSVGSVAIMTVILMALSTFVIGLNARDYLTRGQGGLIELAEALKVSEDTCDQTLYAFRDDMEIVWITGRKNIPIKKDTIIEELPALVLADNRDEKNFQRWAESKGFTFYEIYKFRYKEDYKIYRIKKAGS